MYKKQIIGMAMAFFAFIAIVYTILNTMFEKTSFGGSVATTLIVCVVCMIVGAALVIAGERAAEREPTV